MTDASVVFQAFTASLRPHSGDPYETVKCCFQMLTVLPASRPAVLDHLAAVFLQAPSAAGETLEIGKDREKQLLGIVGELNLKDWSHILGDWCCHVLSRSRFETPCTAFVGNLLIVAYKAGLDAQSNVDWLHPTLLNVPFASRNIFSDLLRRFVANFGQSFVTGLVRCALNVFRQQQSFNSFAVGHSLDHLGNGFPIELQNLVDELLSNDQYSVQMLMDISQNYPQICSVVHSRLASRLQSRVDMKDFTQLMSIPTATTGQGKSSTANLLKRCVVTRSPSWPQLFRAAIASYANPTKLSNKVTSNFLFSKMFLEDLVQLSHDQLVLSLLTTTTDDDVVFLLEKAIQANDSEKQKLVDLKLFSFLGSVALASTAARPDEVMAQVLFDAKATKFNINNELACFYTIAMAACARSVTLTRRFCDCLVDKLLSLASQDNDNYKMIADSNGAGEKSRQQLLHCLWAVGELLSIERKLSHKTSCEMFSLKKHFANRFFDLVAMVATCNSDDDHVLCDMVDFVVPLVSTSPLKTAQAPQNFVEKTGVGLILLICHLMQTNHSEAVVVQSEIVQNRRLLVEKLLFLLHVFVINHHRQQQPARATTTMPATALSSSLSLLLLDAFVRICFDTKNSLFLKKRPNQAIFFQSVKILLSSSSASPPTKPRTDSSVSAFEPGCIWRIPMAQPESYSLVFLAKLIIALYSPDSVHVVASSSFDWTLNATIEKNEPVPVDYREYCLKIRNLVTNSCPFLLDFLSFFIALNNSAVGSQNIETQPVVVLLPVFRALLYAALCCVTATAKSVAILSEQNQSFIIRVFGLLHQARLLRPPLCHAIPVLLEPGNDRKMTEPNQLAIVLRSAWSALISVRALAPAPPPTAMTPILTILKSDLSHYADVLPLFEQPTQESMAIVID